MQQLDVSKQKHNIKNDNLEEVPELRFPEFKELWQKNNLENIAYINKGFTPSTSKKEYWENGEFNWLSIADMGNKYLNYSKKKITQKGTKNKLPIPPNTLVMSFKLSIGKLGILNKPMYTNEAIVNFNWKTNEFDTEFMYYYLSSINILKYGSQAAKGITLNNEILNSIPIIHPSIQEQKKIGNFLSLIDKKLILMQKKHKNIEKIKESIIQKIFSKQFDKLNNESWNTIYLRDVTSIPKKEKLKSIDGRKLLTVKLHCKGVEVNNNIKPKITKRGRPYFERYEGELLIGRQNFHNGGIGFVTKELDSGICSNAITSLKIDESKINPNYLYYYLSRKSFYEKSEVVMGGTGQKELSEKELLKLKIGLPIKEDQKIISNILQSFDYKINLCNNELISLNEFKKGLLQKMFV